MAEFSKIEAFAPNKIMDSVLSARIKALADLKDHKPVRFKHFKGTEYTAIGIGKDVDSESIYIIYRRSDSETGEYHMRLMDAFFAPVDMLKYPCATQFYRFEVIS